jgi:hypothetical protein
MKRERERLVACSHHSVSVTFFRQVQMSARTWSQCLLNTVGMIQKTQMGFVKVASEAHLHFLMSGRRTIGVSSSSFPHSQVAIALPHYCPFQHSSTCTTHESTQDSERRACLSHFLCSNLDHFFKDKGVLHYHCRGRERRALQVTVISQAAQCESDYYCHCSIGLLTCFCLSHYWRHVATRSMDNTKCPSSWDEAKR